MDLTNVRTVWKTADLFHTSTAAYTRLLRALMGNYKQ